MAWHLTGIFKDARLLREDEMYPQKTSYARTKAAEAEENVQIETFISVVPYVSFIQIDRISLFPPETITALR